MHAQRRVGSEERLCSAHFIIFCTVQDSSIGMAPPQWVGLPTLVNPVSKSLTGMPRVHLLGDSRSHQLTTNIKHHRYTCSPFFSSILFRFWYHHHPPFHFPLYLICSLSDSPSSVFPNTSVLLLHCYSFLFHCPLMGLYSLFYPQILLDTVTNTEEVLFILHKSASL